MSDSAIKSRLTLIFPDINIIYNEKTLQIDNDTLLKVSTEDSNSYIVYSQEQYSWPNDVINEKDVRFTYNSLDDSDYHPLLKSILEDGYMQYDSDGKRNTFDSFASFQQGIFSHIDSTDSVNKLNNILTENRDFQSIDLSMSKSKGYSLRFTRKIVIKSEQDYLLDLSQFQDTGIFHASRKLNQRETNIQGLTFNLFNRKWQKTNFYINTFINTVPFADNLISLNVDQAGIHPQLTLNSNINSSKIPFRDEDSCQRYWLLNTPKQVFVNKFDNELKFGTDVWSLVEQSDRIDLELPDYKIDNYSQTYTLFKQSSDFANIKSNFKFNLHDRYIDSKLQDKYGYTSYKFESTVFDICESSDPEINFMKSPFLEKSNVGGFINTFFLNTSSSKVYCNILDQTVNTIEIPSPDVTQFYKLQWITWATVLFSMFYLIKKSLK
ncbi:hypothetical protein QEN19_002992 [Hanseniaspora menglaensis]